MNDLLSGLPSETLMEDLNLGELGGNSPSDVAWLCSLTESEIDFLINLKILVIQRAERLGAEYLAKEFNLKMLRTLGLILMDHLQGNIKDLSDHPKLAVLASRLDACNLLKLNPQDAMTLAEMKACLNSKSKKELVKRPSNAPAVTLKRQKKQSA